MRSRSDEGPEPEAYRLKDYARKHNTCVHNLGEAVRFLNREHELECRGALVAH
jgi:hypothetical protein